MGCSIILRNIGGVDDKRISMSQGQFGRLMSMGNNWNTARIAVRLTIGDTGAQIVSPNLYLGFCSGTAALVGDANTANFIGMRLGSGATNYLRNAGPPVYYTISSQHPMKKVGGVVTASASIGAACCLMADPAYRALFMVEIAKGSPNWTVKLFCKTGSTAVDVSVDQFLDLITVDSPTLSGHQFYSAANVAFDEVAGVINTVNLYWDKTTPAVEISDLAVVRMA
jgi:hypothetical protein